MALLGRNVPRCLTRSRDAGFTAGKAGEELCCRERTAEMNELLRSLQMRKF
jgi:hypothetical protein